MYTFGDHVRELHHDFPDIAPNDADSIVWQAIKDVFSDAQWSFAIAQGQITTEPSYSTGTILLTQNSATVTLSGGVWSTGWTLRRIIPEGRSEDYGITITATTAGTMDAPWPYANVPAGTYQVFRDTYALPSDCDESQLVIILDPARGTLIPLKDFGVFMRRKIEEAFPPPGTPEIATSVATTSAGVPQVRFGAQPPSSVEVYPVYYYRKPTRPTSQSSLIVPAFPERYEDLIYRRARWQAAVDPNYKRDDWIEFHAAYWDRYFEALSSFDGAPAMRRLIRGTVPMLGSDLVETSVNLTVRM